MKTEPQLWWGIGVAAEIDEWPKLGSQKRAANDRNWVMTINPNIQLCRLQRTPQPSLSGELRLP